MPSPYTHTQLTDVRDSAQEAGLGEVMEARLAKDDLEAERTGVGYTRILPSQRQPFGHRHENAEEVYVIISGHGRMKLDDEIVEVVELDAIRVAPQVMRAFEAGPEGLEVLAMGARHDDDAEAVPDWWKD
jgi:mannose-6-phosphate isomerase-like protein (cupin superfamily)